jgi:nucleotide-binding universal stress UspA family protein
MYRYKKLLINLNLSGLDAATIAYSSMISRLAQSEKAFFIHVSRKPEFYEMLGQEGPGSSESLDEYLVSEIKKSIQNNFKGPPGIEINIDVLQGNPFHQLLRYSAKKQIDLIIVSKEKDASKARRLPLKLERRAPCSVLILPHQSNPKISKILVPIDCSENSADAMEVGIAFAAAAGIPEIICLIVYCLPLGYYKTGKSEEQFADIMRKNSEENYSNFIKQFDLKGVSVTPQFVLDKNTVKGIQDAIKREEINLVAMGARGRSTSSAVLIRSVTEKLIKTTNVPIIAVKKKGVNMKFIEALFKL